MEVVAVHVDAEGAAEEWVVVVDGAVVKAFGGDHGTRIGSKGKGAWLDRPPPRGAPSALRADDGRWDICLLGREPRYAATRRGLVRRKRAGSLIWLTWCQHVYLLG